MSTQDSYLLYVYQMYQKWLATVTLTATWVLKISASLNNQRHQLSHHCIMSKATYTKPTLVAKNSALCQLSSTCCAGKLRPADTNT